MCDSDARWIGKRFVIRKQTRKIIFLLLMSGAVHNIPVAANSCYGGNKH